ncbi:hypothetical protein CFT12S02847_08625 [Campylobacter fetus subsp. testudinum]|uniref:Uncharacterized protein n=1 Tax=Campylobacter fetus subsp. testudinum TaxID=1507806 RepID=A0AAX0H8X7_CAMFE|nr:hypothetical protein CFT12S02225_08865 [Campylobacter fetus subsp. testudinum]OCR93647.1 hypothetical protein CFT12S02842_08565 [Campylobacter fetus subsp. testudinum]OCR95449.1 hypothetical protein CFT12S02847_08625 [Campylobacter fetus subsp. testudinum]
MEDVKKFLLFITIAFLIIMTIDGLITDTQNTIIRIVSLIILLPLYFWLDYKLNPHKYKKDS